MMNSDETLNSIAQLAHWQRSRLRPWLVACLVACPVMGLVVTLRQFSVSFPTGYLVPVAFIFSLCSIFAFRHFAVRKYLTSRGWQLKLAGVILVLFIMRIITLIVAGRPLSLDLVQQWFWHPVSFLSVDFLIAGATTIIAAYLAADIESIYWRLGAEQTFAASRPNSEGTETPSHGWGGEAVNRLSGRFFAGAYLMVLQAGLTQIGLKGAESLEIGVSAGDVPTQLILALLIYMILGLTMISQARIISLYAGWTAQEITIKSRIRSFWIPLTILFITIVALLASLLPYGSTGSLVPLLNSILQAIANLLGGILGFFLAALGLLLSVFGLHTETTTVQPSEIPSPEMASPASDVGNNFQHLGPIILWVIIGLMLAYAIVLMVRAISSAGGFKPGSLRNWLHSLMHRTSDTSRAIRRRMRSLRRTRPLRMGQLPELPFKRLRTPRAANKREQLLAYYITTLQKAARAGHPRSPDATPQEYQHILDEGRPDVSADMQYLTRTFILARYSLHPISDQQMQSARSAFERISRHLKQRQ